MCGMKLHSTEYFLSNQLFIFFVAEHVEILLRNIRFIEKIYVNLLFKISVCIKDIFNL